MNGSGSQLLAASIMTAFAAAAQAVAVGDAQFTERTHGSADPSISYPSCLR